MNNEVENHGGSTEISMNVERKEGETMNNEVEIDCDSTEIPTNVEPKEGEIMNNELENHGGSTEIPTNLDPIMKNWKKVLLDQVWSWLKHKDKDEWLKDMRGNLSLVATVIATMTFQMAINPPGGVRSIKDDANPHGSKTANANPPHAYAYPPSDDIGSYDVLCPPFMNTNLCPGEAVLAVIFSDDYKMFIRWNTICFIASLSVLLLLVSGISLNHRFPMWILSIGMCFSLISLAFTYLTAISLVTPDPIWSVVQDFQRTLICFGIGLMSFLALLHTLRLIIWVFYIRKCKILATTPNIARKNIPPA